MDFNLQDSAYKLKNIFHTLENKTYDISHPLQREIEVQKEENKKTEDKIEKISKEKIINIKENKLET